MPPRLANGVETPALGLGVFRFAPGEETRAAVAAALEAGYRHVDTARVYGNERDVGQALAGSGLRREEVFVTTKVWSIHLAPRDLQRSAKDSLRRMRLSDVNLLLIHWPNPRIPLAETIGALCQMKAEGFARHIGVSNFTVPLLEEAVALATEPLVTNQIEWHPFLDQSAVVAVTRKHGLAVTAYSPLVRGKVGSDDVLSTIGMHYHKTAGQVALRWLLQQGAIVIPGTSKVERLAENMDVFDFGLTPDEWPDQG